MVTFQLDSIALAVTDVDAAHFISRDASTLTNYQNTVSSKWEWARGCKGCLLLSDWRETRIRWMMGRVLVWCLLSRGKGRMHLLRSSVCPISAFTCKAERLIEYVRLVTWFLVIVIIIATGLVVLCHTAQIELLSASEPLLFALPQMRGSQPGILDTIITSDGQSC